MGGSSIGFRASLRLGYARRFHDSGDTTTHGHLDQIALDELSEVVRNTPVDMLVVPVFGGRAAISIGYPAHLTNKVHFER